MLGDQKNVLGDIRRFKYTVQILCASMYVSTICLEYNDVVCCGLTNCTVSVADSSETRLKVGH